MRRGKRRAALALAGVLTLLLLAGCGAAARQPTVSMYEMQKTMLAADQTLPEMRSVNGGSEDAAQLFTYLCDLPYDQVEDYFLAYSSAGKADEIAVVAVKDAAQVDAAQKALQAHVQDRLSLYRNYEPDQVARVEKALIFTYRQYAVLIISEGSSGVRQAFQTFVDGEDSVS